MSSDGVHGRARPPAIGGYFELELPTGNGELYDDAVRFQSARAAFTALLLHQKPKRIWMPMYNCGSMREPPKTAGVNVKWYAIGSDLYPDSLGEFDDSDLLLYVNYFGVCARQVARLLQELPRSRVILDHSQAFFSRPQECLATLYSPRKFFGVPDGGYLLTSLDIPAPHLEDKHSLVRFAPLLIRWTEGPEAGYEQFRAAQRTLAGQPVQAMSALTRAMLRGIDYPAVETRRNENFKQLDLALRTINRFPLPADTPPGPMCYPILIGSRGLRDWLIDHRVYVPRYWPGVHGPNNSERDVESLLVEDCVPLPCDQRYDAGDMERVTTLVAEYLDGCDSR